MEYLQAVGQAIYSFARNLGGPGLMLVALADSSFISVPEGNDLLIVVLSTGQSWQLMFYYVVMTVMGSVAGCSLLYWVGRRGGGVFRRRIKEETLEQMNVSYQRWGLWAVIVPSILPPPTPFKIFVLTAGLFQLAFWKFMLAVALGRSIRYSIWGVLAVSYGELAKQFLEKHIHTVGLGLAVAFVLGFGAMWFVRRRRRVF